MLPVTIAALVLALVTGSAPAKLIQCNGGAVVSGNKRVFAIWTFDHRMVIKNLAHPQRTVFLQGVPSKSKYDLYRVSISDDGSILAAHQDESVCVWSTATGKKLASRDDKTYTQEAVSPKGDMIALPGVDCNLIWFWKSNKFKKISGKYSTGATWHHGKLYFFNWIDWQHNRTSIEIVQPENGEVLKQIPYFPPSLFGEGSGMGRVLPSPSGKFAVYDGYRRGGIVALNLQTGRTIHTFSEDDVGFFWQGEKLVVLGWEGPVVLDPATGRIEKYRGKFKDGFDMACRHDQYVLFDDESHRLIGTLPGILAGHTSLPYHMPGP